MPTYKYITRDQNGQAVTGKISAETELLVIEELRKRGLIIVSINEEKASALTPVAKPKKEKKAKPEDIVMFTRQFATMIDAGIPILQALEALYDQTANPAFKNTLKAIREDIQLGSGLSVAFAKHPHVFDPLFINMIRVGEAGGVLTEVLERVALYLEKSEKLRQKVQGALIYPAVIVTMAFAITVLLIIKVVPTFSNIYDSLGQPLPPMTKVLINISKVMQHDFIFLVAGVVALVFAFGRWRATDKGGLVFDAILLKLPVFGDLICKVAVSRFCRTFSTLSQSGVPVLETLEIVGKTCGNRVIEKVVDDVKASVREGRPIAEPLAKSSVFPPMVTRMIAIGEKSGQMEKMLAKVAEFYDDQVDIAVDGMTKLIEPLIIGFLGIVVGFIVIALFMPILNITSALK
ncbi:MAG: type II secretion system F family protein [Candidatus Omnitrophota bacterium]|nr:type II secretion system F family protein [Candidatus Omnitrophota bacterium]